MPKYDSIALFFGEIAAKVYNLEGNAQQLKDQAIDKLDAIIRDFFEKMERDHYNVRLEDVLQTIGNQIGIGQDIVVSSFSQIENIVESEKDAIIEASKEINNVSQNALNTISSAFNNLFR